MHQKKLNFIRFKYKSIQFGGIQFQLFFIYFGIPLVNQFIYHVRNSTYVTSESRKIGKLVSHTQMHFLHLKKEIW